MFNGRKSLFVKNLYMFGFIVAATHGTPSIGQVPCADALFVEHVTTWKYMGIRSILLDTN